MCIRDRLLAALKSRGHEIHGLIVGDSPSARKQYVSSLREKIDQLGLRHHVNLTGWRHDIRDIVAASSIVLSLAQEPESFGRPVLEALYMGVPVVGYGTDDLPGFYARSSGLPLEVRADTPASVSELWDTHTGLGMTGGMVVTVPPPEKEALSGTEIQSAINQSLDQAVADGVRGKHTTPYLLAKVKELTGGASLQVNIALLENNARIASMISNKIVNSDIEKL